MSVKQAELMMLFVTFSWSSSYLLMKIALTGVDPFTLMCLRFTIAFVCVLPLLLKTIKICSKRTVAKGLFLGFMVYASLIGTIVGLKHTTASTAAFLGTTAVVLVPIIEGVWQRKMPPMLTILSIALAFVGLVLFTVKDGLSLDIGALYCLWGAFGYAVYIVVVGRIANEKDMFPATLMQFGAIAIFSGLSAYIFETPHLPQTGMQWGAILGLAVICSAFCFVMQSIVQRYLSPSRTGLIFSMEPVFAAILAYFFLNEVMDGQGLIGALLIMIANVLKNIVYRIRYVNAQRKRKVWNRKRMV
ncbi:DMT family transporter [Veillonella ratti]|uniref:DMT family transporter n=1 Tax=Veillonella ratti TaxID=103892 RepID=UPI000F8D8BBF|nr:DMT family transporter [Veillonella ratti]